MDALKHICSQIKNTSNRSSHLVKFYELQKAVDDVRAHCLTKDDAKQCHEQVEAVMQACGKDSPVMKRIIQDIYTKVDAWYQNLPNQPVCETLPNMPASESSPMLYMKKIAKVGGKVCAWICALSKIHEWFAPKRYEPFPWRSPENVNAALLQDYHDEIFFTQHPKFIASISRSIENGSVSDCDLASCEKILRYKLRRNYFLSDIEKKAILFHQTLRDKMGEMLLISLGEQGFSLNQLAQICRQRPLTSQEEQLFLVAKKYFQKSYTKLEAQYWAIYVHSLS